MGKTALSLNIALNIIKNSKLPVLFFSLEMSKNKLCIDYYQWKQILIK
jgi:replicative DNA helicase